MTIGSMMVQLVEPESKKKKIRIGEFPLSDLINDYVSFCYCNDYCGYCQP